MHATIGTVQVLNERRKLEIASIVDLLHKKGVPSNTLDKQEDSTKQKTPLHYCADTGNEIAAGVLLDVKPSPVNLMDGRKRTALYYACEHHSPNERMIQKLLEHGAVFGDIPIPEMRGKSREGAKRLVKAEWERRAKAARRRRQN